MSKKRRFFAVTISLFILLSLPSCRLSGQPAAYTFYGTFDTVGVLTDYTGMRAAAFAELCAETQAEMERYHRLFDIYHEYDGLCNLATLNRGAGGEPLSLDPDLIEFLVFAKAACARTVGKTNPMLGAVTSLYRACAAAGELPSEDALAEAGKHISIDLLEIDETAGTARITDPAASLDVGAIAKGYAVERVAEWLAGRGVDSFLLNIGGNVRAIGGKPNGADFVAGVKNPLTTDGGYLATVALTDASCATSGSYERYYEIGGVRYSHIINPDTLKPAAGIASVTVVACDSGVADVFSTALFCMSVADGQALVAADADVLRVIWMTEDGTVTEYLR